MSKQETLKTLMKVENQKIQELQPELMDLNTRLDFLNKKITEFDNLIAYEQIKASTHNRGRIDYIHFFDKMSMERQKYIDEAAVIHKKINDLHTILIGFVAQEKAYSYIVQKISEEQKNEEKKKEQDFLDELYRP